MVDTFTAFYAAELSEIALLFLVRTQFEHKQGRAYMQNL
jgi:hypothetical protein